MFGMHYLGIVNEHIQQTTFFYIDILILSLLCVGKLILFFCHQSNRLLVLPPGTQHCSNRKYTSTEVDVYLL